MPFILIPLILLIIGVAIAAVLTLVFGLLHLLLPIIVVIIIWQLIRSATGRRSRPRRHQDWQAGMTHQSRPRKEAHHVKEETAKHHDDDWSDF